MIRYDGFFPSPNMELAICLLTASVICYFLDGVKTKYLQLSVSVTVKSFSCLHGGGSGEEKRWAPRDLGSRDIEGARDDL